jgi:hypothetical protein
MIPAPFPGGWECIQLEEKTTHVHPLGYGHELGGRTCWCSPEIEQLCPICLAREDAKPGCGYCSGVGLVPGFTDDPSWSTVVIHKDATRTMLN